MKNTDPYLTQVPVLVEELFEQFEVVDDGQIIKLVKQNNALISRGFRKVGFKVPTTSTLELDDYSSSVFRLIDGKRTVEQIGQKLSKQYGEDVEPLYERLVMFLENLHQGRNWLEFKSK